jgi:hypothetical protein
MIESWPLYLACLILAFCLLCLFVYLAYRAYVYLNAVLQVWRFLKAFKSKSDGY